MAARPQTALRIGLTGGVGSGKSTVAALLVQHGATLIDTDAIARSLTVPGGIAIDALRVEFGSTAIDTTGALDRAHMRALAFTDASAKARLQAILHPLIGEETERQTQAATGQALVFDVPLLVESTRWRARVDRVLVVDAHEDTQVGRVIERSQWTRETVLAVMAQQVSREKRRAAADAVIFNDGISLDQLADEVRALWQRWCPAEESAIGRVEESR
jgi:dephospho-CoA kinase